MDKRLIGQFKIVVRKNLDTNDVLTEVVNYPMTAPLITSNLDKTSLDDHLIDEVINALLPSIREAVRDLYDRASRQK